MLSKNLVLIGGGTGFIGNNLTKYLTSKGFDVVKISRSSGQNQLTWKSLEKSGLPHNTKYLLNFCGENLFDFQKPWTKKLKEDIWNSRIATNLFLLKLINDTHVKPDLFITISGLGLYEQNDNIEYNETSSINIKDFASKLFYATEKSAELSENIRRNVRNVFLRPGLVIDSNGGVIKQIFSPYVHEISNEINLKNNFFPWIHINDLMKIILFIIKNQDINGILNATAPEQIRINDFLNVYGKIICKKTNTTNYLPKNLSDYFVTSERLKLFNSGVRVSSNILNDFNYQFQFNNLILALKN